MLFKDTPEGRRLQETVDDAIETIAWYPKWMGGDGRLEEAKKLWYAINPDKKPKKIS